MTSPPGSTGYALQPFCVLRTPLLPREALLGLCAPDRAHVRERMAALLSLPHVLAALEQSAPALAQELPRWRQAPQSERGARLERALWGYLARLCARPTPAGLLAGVTLLAPDRWTEVTLGPVGEQRRHSRPPLRALRALAQRLGTADRAALTVAPSAGLVEVGDAFELTHADAQEGSAVRVTRLLPTPALEQVLSLARQGTTLGALCAALASAAEVDAPTARAFVEELLRDRVLETSLEPAPTAAPDRTLGMAQAARAAGLPEAGALDALESALGALDAGGPAPELAARERLRAAQEALQLPPALWVDLYKPEAGAARLGKAVTDAAAAAAGLLARLCPPQDALAPLRARFEARYGEREVPLAEALSAELGVGHQPDHADASTAPLLARFAQAPARSAPASPPPALLRRWAAAVEEGARELSLTAEELEALAAPGALPLPESFSVLCTVLAQDARAVNRGDFQLLVRGVDGPNAVRLLTRAGALHAPLVEQLRAHQAQRAAALPGVALAEVLYVPAGEDAELQVRPHTCPYELVLAGRSSLPPERQLRVEELTLALEGGRFVLRAPGRGLEVRPVLTTPHDFERGDLHPVYRFLGQLAEQGAAPGLRFPWGALEQAPRLPRVVHGRLVLAPQQWTLQAPALRALGAAADAAAAVAALRERLGLPRFCALRSGGTELPLDLENPVCADSLVDRVSSAPSATLVEHLALEHAGAVRGAEGAFVHELVVPFARAPGPAASPHPARPPRPPVAHLPGSRWLHLELYGSPEGCEAALADVVGPLAEAALAQGDAERWFFLRQSDPAWHLRVRLGGEPARLLQRALPAFSEACAALVRAGRLWKLEVGTYQPELRRYGGEEGLALCERLFQRDSEAVLAVTARYRTAAELPLRWRLALAGLAGWLRLLLPPAERLEPVRALRDGHQAALGHGAALRNEVAKLQRESKEELTALMDGATPAQWPWAEGAAQLLQWLSRARPEVEALQAAAASGRLGVPLGELACSVLHLHVNRALHVSPNAHEPILYELLFRHLSRRGPA